VTAPRGLDHIVHAVRDLDATAEFYRRAGFTVGARNRHPWGTHNNIVQFPGAFVELVGVAEPELIPSGTPRSPSFGAFTRDFLARREGLSMLVLEGRGAAEDANAFRAAGIGDFEVFDFAREAKRPDGSTVKVAFSLAFAADRQAPEVGYFTCQQHYPENFWNPAFQNHGNGAAAIAGVVMVAENPADHHVFLQAFSGVRDLKSTSNGIKIQTPRGEIQVVDPQAYRLLFAAEPPDVTRGARLAAIRFSLPVTADAKSILGMAGIVPTERAGSLIVPPDAAHGATLIFEVAKQG
jgi:catechol 2,3-dioxygenase-like lactoylglutathione lyase family enzyme